MANKKMRRIEAERVKQVSDQKYNEFYMPYEVSIDKSWAQFTKENPQYAKLLLKLFGEHARSLHLYLNDRVTEAQANECLVYLDPPITDKDDSVLFERGIG